MDDRLIDNFGAARAPARGRLRIYALLEQGDLPPVCTVGLLDAVRDRSLQVQLVSQPRRFRRPQIAKSAWACEGGSNWWLVDRGRSRLQYLDDDGDPIVIDVLWPLRAAGPDIATALVLLRAEPEHTVVVPWYDEPVQLTTRVEDRVLRVDVGSPPFHSPVFLAPADASDHDLLPDDWPPLTTDPAVSRSPEYAPFLPPLWPAAADLIREAGKAH